MSEESRALAELTKGFWKENPVFIQLLGLCPALAVTNSAINGVAMGVATTFVLMGSSLLVSSLRSFIPKQVRITTYIIVIVAVVAVAVVAVGIRADGTPSDESDAFNLQGRVPHYSLSKPKRT